MHRAAPAQLSPGPGCCSARDASPWAGGWRCGSPRRCALALAPAGAARAAERAELTALDLVRDEDGLSVNFAVDFELSKERRGRAGQGRAALLRRRGPGLSRPLVLARPTRRRRGAGLAHRLPAADRNYRVTFGGLTPDLHHPRRGHRRDQPQQPLEDRRARADRGRPPLRRVQLPARHHPAAAADADRRRRARPTGSC